MNDNMYLRTQSLSEWTFTRVILAAQPHLRFVRKMSVVWMFTGADAQIGIP